MQWDWWWSWWASERGAKKWTCMCGVEQKCGSFMWSCDSFGLPPLFPFLFSHPLVYFSLFLCCYHSNAHTQLPTHKNAFVCDEIFFYFESLVSFSACSTPYNFIFLHNGIPFLYNYVYIIMPKPFYTISQTVSGSLSLSSFLHFVFPLKSSSIVVLWARPTLIIIPLIIPIFPRWYAFMHTHTHTRRPAQ